MPGAERPLLLVDVDGVLSLFGPDVDRTTCTPALVEGFPHFLSRRSANLLTRLAGSFECVWCTGSSRSSQMPWSGRWKWAQT